MLDFAEPNGNNFLHPAHRTGQQLLAHFGSRERAAVQINHGPTGLPLLELLGQRLADLIGVVAGGSLVVEDFPFHLVVGILYAQEFRLVPMSDLVATLGQQVCGFLLAYLRLQLDRVVHF